MSISETGNQIHVGINKMFLYKAQKYDVFGLLYQSNTLNEVLEKIYREV